MSLSTRGAEIFLVIKKSVTVPSLEITGNYIPCYLGKCVIPLVFLGSYKLPALFVYAGKRAESTDISGTLPYHVVVVRYPLNIVLFYVGSDLRVLRLGLI